MKHTMLKIATMLCLITSTSSCASSLERSVPKLELRKLDISDEVAGFQYRYCDKWNFLKTKCKNWVVEKYDLNDVELRKKLKSMGFVLQVREKP